jgi:hypothetical protein
MVEGTGVVGIPACAQKGGEEIEKEEEKDNAETWRAPRSDRGKRRLPREEGDGRLCRKANFTKHFTADVMTCQVISHIVMIRTACLWGIS